MIGFSRYSLKPNSNNWRLFFAYTVDKKILNMLEDLCTIENIDEEMSGYVKRRDFNYIDVDDIVKIHSKYFLKERKLSLHGDRSSMVERWTVNPETRVRSPPVTPPYTPLAQWK